MVDPSASPAAGLIGSKPRPRVLLLGDVPDEIADAVTAVAPTVERVGSLDEVRLEEWDVVVTVGGVAAGYRANRLHVLAFAGGTGDSRRIDGVYDSWSVDWMQRVRCNEFQPVFGDAPPELATLIEATLLPYYRRPDQSYWTFSGDNVAVLPLAQDATGAPLGLIYRRRPRPKKPPIKQHAATLAPIEPAAGCAVVVLTDLAQRGAWVRQVFRYLARQDPQAFTGLRDWQDDRDWHTPDQAEAEAGLAAARTERDRVLVELDSRIAALSAAADQARRDASGGVGRLLREQGTALVDAVEDALTELGFTTDRPDNDPARRGDLLEDLQVRDPHVPEWVALVEVRGYPRGAELGDLARIERFTTRFVQTHNRRPLRRWYVVNHHLHDHPSHRPDPLASNPGEVAEFTADDGLVLDTRALFQIVNEPAETHPQRRAQLREATGVVVRPPATGDPAQ